MNTQMGQEGFGVTSEAVQVQLSGIRSAPRDRDARTSPPFELPRRRSRFDALVRGAALIGAMAFLVDVGRAAVEEYPWGGVHHDFELGRQDWGLNGQMPARFEVADIDGDVGADLAIRYSPSNSLIVFMGVRGEMRPYRVALSGVTDFAVLPSGSLVFANSQGLNLATWVPANDAFTVTAVSGSSAFADATHLSTSGSVTAPHVAAVRSHGAGIAWSTLQGSAIGTSFAIAAPPNLVDVTLLRWNSSSSSEVDIAVRTDTTVSVRKSSDALITNQSYPTFGAQTLFTVQRGTTYDRMHMVVDLAPTRWLWTIDPVLGGLNAISAGQMYVSKLSFGDYDGVGTNDVVVTNADGTGVYVLYGNAWNEVNPFSLNSNATWYLPLKDCETGGLTALADFEGDGDPDVMQLSAANHLEILANDRLNEDSYLFKMNFSTSNQTSLLNHVATLHFSGIQMDPPHDVAASATHVAIEIFLQDSATSLVSAAPWQSRLVPIPAPIFVEGENGSATPMLLDLPPQTFSASLGAHPDSAIFHIRFQSVHAPNGSTITKRVAPALSATFAFDATVEAELVLQAAVNAWSKRHDVDPLRVGDGNRESAIVPLPPRP